jgi:hypothetical protein
MSQDLSLKLFNFNSFTRSSALLIAEYCDSVEQPATDGREAVTLVNPRIHQAVKACWLNLWQPELDAEAFITPWLEKKVFVVDQKGTGPEDRPFRNAAHVLLVDMAMAPTEKQFLQELGTKLQEKRQFVYIQREAHQKYLGDLFEAFFEPDPLFPRGSAAVSSTHQIRHCNSITLHRVQVCLEQNMMCLHKDLQNKFHLKPISARRTLAHELVHIYQNITGKGASYLTDVPKTLCWTNGYEMMAIRGYGKSRMGLLRDPYSENAFACSYGEMERVSHSVAVAGGWPKEALLIKALEVGAVGTVRELLKEAEARCMYSQAATEVVSELSKKFGQEMEVLMTSFVDEIVSARFKAPKASSATAAATATAAAPKNAGSEMENTIRTLLESALLDFPQLNSLLDIRFVSASELFRAYTQGATGLKFTKEDEDQSLQEKIVSGRKEAYSEIVTALHVLGQTHTIEGLKELEKERALREETPAQRFVRVRKELEIHMTPTLTPEELEARMAPIRIELEKIGEDLKQWKKQFDEDGDK